MAWPTSRVDTWQQFEDFFRKLAISSSALSTGFLYRGQSDNSWQLQAVLSRTFKAGITDQEAKNIEGELIGIFRSQAHIYLRPDYLPKTDNQIEWWQIMQHYSAPTRLIDWTESIYVAAYFAVVHQWDKDGAIWLMPPSIVNDAATTKLAGVKFEDAVIANNPDLTMAVPMTRYSNRTLAQQGHFTLSTNILGKQGDFIDAECSIHAQGKDQYHKLSIDHSLKPEILFRLKQMNVTAASLFPGEDGIGKSLNELALLSSKY
jgi:hypothetical protein